MTVMPSLYLSLRTASSPATRAVYTLAGIEMAGAGMTEGPDHFTLSSRELLGTYEAFEGVIIRMISGKVLKAGRTRLRLFVARGIGSWHLDFRRRR